MTKTTLCSRRHILEQQFYTWPLSCFNGGHIKDIEADLRNKWPCLVRHESITKTTIKFQTAEVSTYRKCYIELKSR